MTDLRDRFRSLDTLEVPDVMARADLIGPRIPAPETPSPGRRIGALVVAALVTIAAVLLVVRAFLGPTTTPSDPPAPTPVQPSPVGQPTPEAADQGEDYIDLPPPGATASQPVVGELVLSLEGIGGSLGDHGTSMYVYADGRLLLRRLPGTLGEADYSEQRLTAEGVESLLSEVESSGLFARDTTFDAKQDRHSSSSLRIQLTHDGRTAHLVSIPSRFAATVVPSGLQAESLDELVALLTDPTRLSQSAFAQPEPREFVPARIAIRMNGNPRRTDLPDPADELLRGVSCQIVPTRVALDAIKAFNNEIPLTSVGLFDARVFRYTAPLGGDDEALTSFEPALPHETSC
ncbi:MAG: hypothetical protein WEA10_04830 [Actinomycetota bacterium]